MNIGDYLVKPGQNVNLTDWDPGDDAGIPDKETGKAILKEKRKEIIRLQEQLFAENQQSLLVVFQAMDTGGKDGCIENVFKGVNPSGVRVRNFKTPTELEISHDFLWRVHQHTPPNGHISVFNRSHYEDVLVVRVKDLVPESVWQPRFAQINAFEETLAAHNTRIIKFYLHISKDEQKKRLEARLENPDKHWKFSAGDLAERERWDAYQKAFEDALSKTSTSVAPWYVVPANRKWFRDVVVSSVILNALQEMNPQYPEATEDLSGITVPE